MILSGSSTDADEHSQKTGANREENATKRSDDLNMDEERKEEKQPKQNTIEEQSNKISVGQEVEKKNEIERSLQGSPPSTDETFKAKNSPVDLSTESNTSPSKRHTELLQGENKRIQTMATTSENPSRSSPLSLQNNTKATLPTGKAGENLFGGAGGVTTVDPFFQMSLFQSRNSCKTLKCPRCNWHYKYRQTLDAHMKEKHVDETSDCLYCNANQPHPRLSRGESYACGYKPFKCEVCNYSTTTKGNLSIHMQSDKHLYNVKTMQHHQQNKEKVNGQTQGNSITGSALPARLLAEKQEHMQNLLQARNRSSPDGVATSSALHRSSQSRKGSREFPASPNSTGPSNRRPVWRCDVCNYETDYSRNLRIHMQSEKHAHNLTLAGNATARRSQETGSSNNAESAGEDENNDLDEVNAIPTNNSSGNSNQTPSVSSMDQSSPSPMAALYYYLTALQSSMQQSQTGELQSPPNAEEREKQQKQFLAQQQQLILAQQYQQMLAQLTGSGDISSGGTSAAFLQQQILLQQQLQVWRQLLAQGDDSHLSNAATSKQGECAVTLHDTNIPASTSTHFLFTCGICCNFSCNDLESLCTHVRTPRYSRTSQEDGEWVLKSPVDGYLCRICSYTTQLKTNFSLHCKTEKHTSKLQLINHIREGGEANEWKVSYAISGNNMNKITCNGCRHSATSIDKLRIHCSTDRHQGTLTMCHYLDTMLKEAELSKGLRSSEGITSHHLLCRPCSYQSKFVVEMIQHMQCQNHQAKVHQEQQRGNVSLADMVAAEPDQVPSSNDQEEDESQTQSNENDVKKIDGKEDCVLSAEEETSSKRTYGCHFCNYETGERSRLQLHNVTQHHSQSVIKCPMCPEYLSDTVHFQLHLIEVHKLTGREDNSSRQPRREESTNPSNMVEGTLKAIQLSCKQVLEEKSGDEESSAETLVSKQPALPENCKNKPTSSHNDAEEPFLERCQHCGDILTTLEKWQLHLEIHRIQASAAASASSDHHGKRSCTACQTSFSTLNQLRQHLQTKHHTENIQRGKEMKGPLSTEVETLMDADEPDQGGDASIADVSDSDDKIFSDPRLLLSTICSDATFSTKAMKDPRFERVWDELEPPFSCRPCEETFVCKFDLYEHLQSNSTHTLRETNQTEPNERSSEQEMGDVTLSAETTGSRDRTKQFPLDVASDKTESADSTEEESEPKTEGDGKCQGISKSTHRKVLENVGFDQVAHFVENRSSENRERATKWKRENLTLHTNRGNNHRENVDGNNNDVETGENFEERNGVRALEKDNELDTIVREATESHPSNAPDDKNRDNATLSQLTCVRCGKEFSNMWILKVHEKNSHNVDMSSEMLEEFVRGYTTWYWDCVKKDMEEGAKNGLDDPTQSSDDPDSAGKPSAADSASWSKIENSTENTATEDTKGFQQAALQALMKNYPGLVGSYETAPSPVPQPQSPPTDDQSKLQQQMLLQMLMTAQTQAAVQQQVSTTNQAQVPTQTNASNIMNMLVEHLYGAAMHGVSPGFMDPMTVMSLLQQQQHQQQPRLPGAGGVNPYQWLAMRYLQQQQMQQLLMYPAMATSGAGVPFMPSLSDANQNQQQILAAFAASLMSPGGSPDTTGSMPNNPIAAALHAYQLQAAAANASLAERRSGGKDPEPDPGKTLRKHQRDSTNIITQPPQSVEVPTKRPRTRITDDQLKVLRANFDINTSPSENQISDMAIKTNLPPKVIKHWFRNTLFKERQRSKDSPYNFSIPPLTSLDNIARDGVRASSDTSREDSSPLNMKYEPGLEDQTYPTNDEQRRVSEHSSNGQTDLHGASPATAVVGGHSMSESEAIKILKSMSERSSKNADVRRTIFNNPMSLMHNLDLAPEAGNAGNMASNRANEIGRHATAEKDVMQILRQDMPGDSQAYGYDQTKNEFAADYSYHPNQTTGSISTITRRTPRTRFSDYQLKLLQDFFDKNAYPKDEDLDKLSRMMDLSTRVIVVWFQNARQKARKSYETQQGAMHSIQHANGLPTLSTYPRKRLSAPSSPVAQSSKREKIFATSRPTDIQSLSKTLHQYSRDLVPQNKSPLGFPTAVVKEEPRRRDYAASDASLTAMDTLQHYDRLQSSAIQQYKMYYPSIIEGMVQSSASKDSENNDVAERNSERGRSSESPDHNDRRLNDVTGKNTERTQQVKSQASHAIDDIINRFVLPQKRSEDRRRKDSSDEQYTAQLMQNQFASQREEGYATKRKLSVSPTQSVTSPNSNRGNLGRKGINDSSKDPKRLRTTITPEQLEFLYQQYLVDSSPSRKVIEQISDIVGLKKRVVQVWFQNTRARERKGQFRSVGRITSVLGLPQICPHCRVTFRTKADLDAHVRYRHMQSPSTAAISLPQTQHHSSDVNSLADQKPTIASLSHSISASISSSTRSEEQNQSVSKGAHFDYKEIFNNINKQMEKYSGQSHSTKLHGSVYEPTKNENSKFSSLFSGSGDHESLGSHSSQSLYSGDDTTSPKRRKTSESDPSVSVTSSATPKLALTSKTSEIYKAVSEQIFGSKGPSSVDVIAQRLQGKAAMSASDPTARESTRTPPTLEREHIPTVTSQETGKVPDRGSPSPPVSSPGSVSSSASLTFMVPHKRYRTQMTSLQVRSLRHCFSEYKTPTLLECEMLGAQIGLPKRVIQVWFQNARAKEKKAKQGDSLLEYAENPTQLKSSCGICPEMRFGSLQEYRNHIFSKNHLQNLMSSCDGDASDDQSRSSGRRTPSSDNDYFQSKDPNCENQQPERASPPALPLDGVKFRASASVTTNGPFVTKSQAPINTSGWEATAYALTTNPALSQKYQQFAAMQKFMNAGSMPNGVDERSFESDDQNRPSNEVSFSSLNQSWIQQTLLASRIGNDSKGRHFEGMSSIPSRTEE